MRVVRGQSMGSSVFLYQPGHVTEEEQGRRLTDNCFHGALKLKWKGHTRSSSLFSMCRAKRLTAFSTQHLELPNFQSFMADADKSAKASVEMTQRWPGTSQPQWLKKERAQQPPVRVRGPQTGNGFLVTCSAFPYLCGSPPTLLLCTGVIVIHVYTTPEWSAVISSNLINHQHVLLFFISSSFKFTGGFPENNWKTNVSSCIWCI